MTGDGSAGRMTQRTAQRIQWILWTVIAVYLVLSLRWDGLLPRRFSFVALAVCLFLGTPLRDWRKPIRLRWPGAREAVDYAVSLLVAATVIAGLAAIGDGAFDRVIHNTTVNTLMVCSVVAFGLRRALWGANGKTRTTPEDTRRNHS